MEVKRPLLGRVSLSSTIACLIFSFKISSSCLSFSKSLSSKCSMEMIVHVSQGCDLGNAWGRCLVHNSWWWIRALRQDSHPLSSLNLCWSSYSHTFILRPGRLGSKRPHLPAPSWLGSFQVQRHFLVLWFVFPLFITPGEQLMSGKITNLEKRQKLKKKKSHY